MEEPKELDVYIVFNKDNRPVDAVLIESSAKWRTWDGLNLYYKKFKALSNVDYVAAESYGIDMKEPKKVYIVYRESEFTSVFGVYFDEEEVKLAIKSLNEIDSDHVKNYYYKEHTGI